MKRLLAMCVLLLPLTAVAGDRLQGLLQMLDYVGVDYPEAVAAGKVTNPAEYAEMEEFSSVISKEIKALPQSASQAQLQRQARELGELIALKADPAAVGQQVMAMRKGVLANYPVAAVPGRVPDLGMAASLYAGQCASCHGAEGRGDGFLATGLEPAPTDFTERERYAQRTLYGLYNTISLGVAETAMRPFEELTEHQRWSLAFYVGQLALGPQQAVPAVGGESLQALTTLAPVEVAAEQGPAAAARFAYLRQHPETLFAGHSDPLAFAAQQLQASLAAYRRGEAEQAHKLAVDAYLEGFELAESGLSAVDGELTKAIEHAMADYRAALSSGQPTEALAAQVSALDGLLAQAAERLETTTLSSGAAFSGALVILLREGLEAILVVAAIAAFLIKTGRRDAMRYLHYGWTAALAAGGLTWWVSTYLWEIGGAGRELTEAVAAVVAAAVLFYVGFWLHSKTHAVRWKQFIEQSVNRALSGATLWSLAGLSFITVYREAFETILFYQALWVQTDSTGQGMVLSGLLTAAAVLAVLDWFILRYSTRLPLRQFFAVTGALVFVLAVVFAGKGIAAFQEAGKLSASPIDMPAIELLGIYPNLEGLAVQAAMVLLALFLLFGRRQPVAG